MNTKCGVCVYFGDCPYQNDYGGYTVHPCEKMVC
jgi:hypothetical protein